MYMCILDECHMTAHSATRPFNPLVYPQQAILTPPRPSCPPPGPPFWLRSLEFDAVRLSADRCRAPASPLPSLYMQAITDLRVLLPPFYD